MHDEIVYMLAVIAACFAVNFGLRALPFVLFAGKSRELPKWVRVFGAFVSPVIIACLIVYSFATLAPLPDGTASGRTAWPYLAGALTVALQLLRRNPLVSIVAGTALYMTLVNCCGCRTVDDDLRMDGSHPCVAVTDRGIRFVDRYVKPDEVPRLLEKHNVPKTATIHILLEDDQKADSRAVWVFRHNILARAGYSRSITVSERKALSAAGDGLRRRPPESVPPPKSVPVPPSVRHAH